MRALVTGGGGQVGRAILEAAPKDWQVTALARQQLDIADPSALAAVLDHASLDIVINAAAYTRVDLAESEPEEAHRINGKAVGDLAGICESRSVRLVHFSSDFVFSGAHCRPYLPSDSADPQNSYGKSKLAGEQAVRRVPANLVIRTAWIYSVHGVNFARTMLRLMGERDPLKVVSDQVGTPTHAPSLARATWALIDRGATGVHHFTDAGVASRYDFAVAIQEEALAAGLLERSVPILPIMTEEYPTPARRPPYSVLDKSSTWQMLGRPPSHWRVELRGMLSALKGSSSG